jgi:hypothetical protein
LTKLLYEQEKEAQTENSTETQVRRIVNGGIVQPISTGITTASSFLGGQVNNVKSSLNEMIYGKKNWAKIISITLLIYESFQKSLV